MVLPLALGVASIFACGDDQGPAIDGHGPIAEGIMAPLGDPVPSATADQLATFERGRAVAERRFTFEDGLGPVFNVTFCGSCHEKPTTGGSSGLYRNFFLAGTQVEGGGFFAANEVALFDCGSVDTPPEERQRNPPPESVEGAINGVVRQFGYAEGGRARPDFGAQVTHTAQRNAIPFFGVGLIAELTAEEISSRADPDDEDGDGISGRVNMPGGFVGRFGTKAQTADIEGFIRGPIFNHAGITSDPLTDDQRSRLPVDSSSAATTAARAVAMWLRNHAQAASPGSPNCDLDDVLDPELAPDDLFDLVSFAMLLAAPPIEPLNDQTRRGLEAFDQVRCGDCHTPRLSGPRGPIPVYSDLLLHDMGPDLDDGISFMADAESSEFRTQPLWGISATGPYLHDGRAITLEEAILAHGGEAQTSRDLFDALGDTERADLIEFLRSLGGRSQVSVGLIPPDEPEPSPGSFGGPLPGLSSSRMGDFTAGRLEFDREFGHAQGVGGPRFNGDSCRACHFEPVVGGAGPRGVNVMRHGILNESDQFVAPAVGTILHKTTTLSGSANLPQEGATIFEHRQTPALFGLGLVDAIPDEVIAAGADPDDGDGDGISGRVALVDGGRIGRFGWKAQVPSLAEFVRDAVTAELGMTLAAQEGLTFGAIHDNDAIPDPEMSLDQAAALLDYMMFLAPPPRQAPGDQTAAEQGKDLFESVGCIGCHTPELDSPAGPVALYSDLLLHEILPEGATGIEDGSANMREFRTAPLWGISATAPYLHSGAAETIDEAIRLHDGEAAQVVQAYEDDLTDGERSALLEFLGTL